MTSSKQNFRHITDWLKKTAKATASLISQQYEKNKQEQLAMQKLNRIRICEQAAQDYMYQIHPELADNMLRQTNISTRLTPLRYPYDLLPYDYTIRPDYSIRLYFLWAKSNPQEILSQTTLDVIKEKMNLAIRSTFNRYRLVYQQMNDYEKSEFLWNHPSFNFGFHITNCWDIGNDIQIEIALGFPK